jgi:hypothetical protein
MGMGKRGLPAGADVVASSAPAAAPATTLLPVATLAALAGYAEVSQISRLCRTTWHDMDLLVALVGPSSRAAARRAAVPADAGRSRAPKVPREHTLPEPTGCGRLRFAAQLNLADRTRALLAAGSDPNVPFLTPANRKWQAHANPFWIPSTCRRGGVRRDCGGKSPDCRRRVDLSLP